MLAIASLLNLRKGHDMSDNSASGEGATYMERLDPNDPLFQASLSEDFKTRMAALMIIALMDDYRKLKAEHSADPTRLAVEASYQALTFARRGANGEAAVWQLFAAGIVATPALVQYLVPDFMDEEQLDPEALFAP